MASLQKNGKNYSLLWTDSKRHPQQVRESLKTDNRNKATAKKKELEWKYVNGEHDPWRRKWYEKEIETSVLLGPLIEMFLSYKSDTRGREGWSDSVRQRETYVMRKFARHIGEHIPVQNITADNLESFYYRDGVTSNHTRHGDYISVNTFLNWAVKNEYIDSKPEYRPSKPQSKLPKYITPQQLRTLIRYRVDKITQDLKDGMPRRQADAAYWSPLSWMILAGTGLRPIELSHLKTSHIYKDNLIVGEDFTTKTKAERMVPLLYESRQAAHLLISSYFRSRETHMQHTDYLTGRKPQYARKELSYDFSKTWKACFPDQPKRTLYNLKDMFAVRFLCDESLPSPSGMKLNDLREILGHASLETTQRYLKAVSFGTNIQGTIFDY